MLHISLVIVMVLLAVGCFRADSPSREDESSQEYAKLFCLHAVQGEPALTFLETVHAVLNPRCTAH